MTDPVELPVFVLPEVYPNLFDIDISIQWEVRVWKDGQLTERYIKPGDKVQAFAEGLFRFRNNGQRLPAAWQRLGDELKIAFARPWIEGDTVVYLAPSSGS